MHNYVVNIINYSLHLLSTVQKQSQHYLIVALKKAFEASSTLNEMEFTLIHWIWL